MTKETESILYLGAASGTSLHRADALRRLGYQMRVVDPNRFVPKGRVARRFHYETGGLFAENAVMKGVLNSLSGDTYQVVWVDNGPT